MTATPGEYTRSRPSKNPLFRWNIWNESGRLSEVLNIPMKSFVVYWPSSISTPSRSSNDSLRPSVFRETAKKRWLPSLKRKNGPKPMFSVWIEPSGSVMRIRLGPMKICRIPKRPIRGLHIPSTRSFFTPVRGTNPISERNPSPMSV